MSELIKRSTGGGEEEIGGGYITLRLDETKLNAELAQLGGKLSRAIDAQALMGNAAVSQALKSKLYTLQMEMERAQQGLGFAKREGDPRAIAGAEQALVGIRDKMALVTREAERQIQTATQHSALNKVLLAEKEAEARATMRLTELENQRTRAAEIRAARQIRKAMAGPLGLPEDVEGGILESARRQAAMAALAPRVGFFDPPHVKEAKEEMARLGKTTEEAAHSQRKLGVAAEMGGRHGGLAAMKWMLLAQTLDDMQYGFSAIVNNIPMVVGAFFGFGSAAAAGIAIGAVAVNQLLQHWDQLMGLMGQGVPQPALHGLDLLQTSLKKATEEMEKLRAKTSLTYEEAARLQELPGEIAGLEEAVKTREAGKAAFQIESPEVAENKAAFEEAAKFRGGRELYEHLKAALERGQDINMQAQHPLTGERLSPGNIARDLFGRAGRGSGEALASIRQTMQGAFGLGDEFAHQIAVPDPLARQRQVGKQLEDEYRAKMHELDFEDRREEQQRLNTAARAAFAGPQREAILRGQTIRLPETIEPDAGTRFAGSRPTGRSSEFERAISQLRERAIEEAQARFPGMGREQVAGMLAAEAANQAEQQKVGMQMQIEQARMVIKKEEPFRRFGSWEDKMASLQTGIFEGVNPEKAQLKVLEKIEAKLKIDELIKKIELLNPKMP